MSNKYSFVLYFVFFCNVITVVWGQKKTYFGIAIEGNKDHFILEKSSLYLSRPISASFALACQVEQELRAKISLEVGLKYKLYFQRVYNTLILDRPIVSIELTTSYNAYQFPIRFKTSWALPKTKLTLRPSIGYVLGLNREYKTGTRYFGGGTIANKIDTLTSFYDEKTKLSYFFHLLELGLGFDFELSANAQFTIGTAYLLGFQKVSSLDFTYFKNSQLIEANSIYSKGSYFSLAIGFKYNIARFFPAKRKKIKRYEDYLKVEDK